MEVNKSRFISELAETDFSSFERLFMLAFKHKIDKQVWQWKYHLTPPQLPAHSLGIWDNGDLVGHYAGFVRNIQFFGQTQKAIQIGDTMTAPQVRGVLTKNGIFNQLATHFLNRYIGFNAPYLLGFGFPSFRVMKLAVRLGLYNNAGRFTRLLWDTPKKTTASLFYQIRSVSYPISYKDKLAIDQLWLVMAKQCHQFIIGVRNWEHLYYRYILSPLHEYKIFKINNRLTRQLAAIIVIRFEADKCILVDFIAPLQQIPMLIDASIRIAVQENKTQLSCLISDNLRHLFAKRPYIEIDPKIAIPHCAYTRGPSIEQVKNKWWLMAGDSDFM